MTTGNDSIDALVAVLRSLVGRVETRFLCGATGLTLDGAVFGILSEEGRLYYRTDHLNRRDFEEYEALSRMEETGDFCPRGDLPGGLSYRAVPTPVLDDPETLGEWTRKAWEAAKRARKAGK